MKEDKAEYETRVKLLVQKLLTEQGLKLTDLHRRMKACGYKGEYIGFAQKVSKSRFSLSFFLEILDCLGKRIDLVDDREDIDEMKIIEMVKKKCHVYIGMNRASRLLKMMSESIKIDSIPLEGIDLKTGLPVRAELQFKDLQELEL